MRGFLLAILIAGCTACTTNVEVEFPKASSELEGRYCGQILNFENPQYKREDDLDITVQFQGDILTIKGTYYVNYVYLGTQSQLIVRGDIHEFGNHFRMTLYIQVDGIVLTGYIDGDFLVVERDDQIGTIYRLRKVSLNTSCDVGGGGIDNK